MVLDWNFEYWCEFPVFKIGEWIARHPQRHKYMCLVVVVMCVYRFTVNPHYFQIPYLQIHCLIQILITKLKLMAQPPPWCMPLGGGAGPTLSPPSSPPPTASRTHLLLPLGPTSSLPRSRISPKMGGDKIKPPPITGRFGTSLKMGIVGLPNVGASTFFDALAHIPASADNFPFCTPDPDESRVPMPDDRLDFLCQNHKAARKIPAFLSAIGRGAHSEPGLGRVCSSHRRACDGPFT